MKDKPTHDTRTVIVVVGNGMASHVLCQSLVDNGVAARSRVIVFGGEEAPAYNRVRLSDVMQGVEPSALSLAPISWYARHGIDVRLGTTVNRIDRGSRCVYTADGNTQPYDRLVLATGSVPFRPSLPGIEHARCHVYRTLADLQAIELQLDGAERAVVIGGGLLGLEAAKVLLDRQLSVHVVEAGGSLMHRQLDAESAEVLQREIESLGVTVHTGASIERIEHLDSATVVLKGAARIFADIVIVAAGVRANDQLARAAELDCNVRGGVVVDGNLTTSDPLISAIGECASVRGSTFGLYAPCREMAVALAHTLSGGSRPIGAFDLSCHLKLLGVDVVALGDYGNEHRAFVFAGDRVRRTLLVERGVLVGAMAVGDFAERTRVERAIAQGKRVSERELKRFVETGSLWTSGTSLPMAEWGDAAIVCNCKRVTAGEIRAHARAGAVDVSLIAARTQATSVCGSCKPLIGALVGDASSALSQTRTWGILGLSIAAMLSALAVLLVAPLKFAESVNDAWTAIDRFWRDPWLKQVTGFVLAGLATTALVISLRKRVSMLRFGSFALYRALHATIGIGTLLTLLVHTGFRLGHNLNLWLMVAFLLLNIVGAATGVLSGLEARVELPIAATARRLRAPFALAHIVMFWPLPLLLVWHVVAVYYF